MKKVIQNVTLDEERALYASNNLKLINVSLDGPADGESAVKESKNIEVENCFCNLRYPFWHVKNLKIKNTRMTGLCRAALWYSHGVEIENSNLLGIKAVRECRGVRLYNCEVSSPEFGWFTRDLQMKNCSVESEYFLLRACGATLEDVDFTGKYSFQYAKDVKITGGSLNTKDAFWHSKGVTVENCNVVGEYIGWYSDGLTFINCTISGTQPFCYCKNLKLINCRVQNFDLAFEKSEVEAQITTHVESIKNFYKGHISAPSVGEIIKTDKKACGDIEIIKK